MRFAFSWQHSDDRLASRHLIPRLDPHLRLLRQIEVHARSEPDQPVPLAAGYPLALGEPADDAPRHVPGHLHTQHALAPVSLEQRRHLFLRPRRVRPARHQEAAAAARKGSPSRAIGQPRARSAMDQFLVLSTSWSFLSHGIMARNRAPTSSIGCCSPRLSKALYWGRLAWHSSIHSLANRPLWISSRMRFISCLVSSVMMRGPRVTSPYFAVVLIE